MESKTIFEKIIHREIPADIIYEDEESIAFLDIRPVSLGHTLLITKKPYTWMQDVPDELLGKMFTKTKMLMNAMKQGLGCEYVQISVIGKEVPHFHIHLIPRALDDKLVLWDHTTYENNEQKEMVINKIKIALREK